MSKRKDDPKLVDAVLLAGEMCSNCCYNIGANRRQVTEHDWRSMVESYKAYDAARKALLESRKAK